MKPWASSCLSVSLCRQHASFPGLSYISKNIAQRELCGVLVELLREQMRGMGVQGAQGSDA